MGNNVVINGLDLLKGLNEIGENGDFGVKPIIGKKSSDPMAGRASR
jgi:hypothetical protein